MKKGRGGGRWKRTLSTALSCFASRNQENEKVRDYVLQRHGKDSTTGSRESDTEVVQTKRGQYQTAGSARVCTHWTRLSQGSRARIRTETAL